MNIIEYDFDLLKLDGNGQFNDTNRSLYESTVKKRGLEGWNFCHHSFVIVQKEKDEDSYMASYLTWSREKHPIKYGYNSFQTIKDDPSLAPDVLVDFLSKPIFNVRTDDPNPVPMSDRQVKAFLEVFQMRLKPYAADDSLRKQTDAIDDAT